MSSPPRLFRFAQFEFPWPLGPPDGRYLVRAPGPRPALEVDRPASHVVVFATLGAPERRRLAARRRARAAEPEPSPSPVATGRATVIDVADPFAAAADAGVWLTAAGEIELAAALAQLNRALHAFRIATTDPDMHPAARDRALVARLGYGGGEEVADGLWTDARELPIPSPPRRRRVTALAPQARLAALLSARRTTLVCEELALRARHDLDHGRPREAALGLMVALDAAVAELAADPLAAELGDRIAELRTHRDPIAAAAQTALTAPLGDAQLNAVADALGRLEAALRARAVNAD